MAFEFICVVSERKIRSYLLSAYHKSGGSKAKFFNAAGFTDEQWAVLAEALKRHAREASLAKAVESQFGMTYVYEGMLHTPTGKRPNVRSVWGSALHFVTAYPLRQVKQ